MKNSFFTENRLIFNAPPESPPAPVVAPAEAAPQTPAAIATPVAETRAEIQSAQQTPEKPKNFFNFPWEFMRTTKGRIARTVGGLVFAPWLAVEAAMFAARSTEVAAKKAAFPVLKSGYERVSAVSSTVGHNVGKLIGDTVRLPFRGLNTSWNLAGGVGGTAIGGVEAGLGATAWGVRNLTTRPLSWATQWIPGVNYLTNKLDNTLLGTQEKLFNWSGSAMNVAKKGYGGVGYQIGETWGDVKDNVLSIPFGVSSIGSDILYGKESWMVKNQMEKTKAKIINTSFPQAIFSFGGTDIAAANDESYNTSKNRPKMYVPPKGTFGVPQQEAA